MHACMACNAGIDLHACVYRWSAVSKELLAAKTQICQSCAAMPDRMTTLMATKRLAAAMFIMFDLQKPRGPEVTATTHALLVAKTSI